jgi:hypothetical protein
MTSPDQIKTIAADFLRALATVPGLLARWQNETSSDVRADIVRAELNLRHALHAGDVAKLAEHTAPFASDIMRAKPLMGIPLVILEVQPPLASAAA